MTKILANLCIHEIILPSFIKWLIMNHKAMTSKESWFQLKQSVFHGMIVRMVRWCTYKICRGDISPIHGSDPREPPNHRRALSLARAMTLVISMQTLERSLGSNVFFCEPPRVFPGCKWFLLLNYKYLRNMFGQFIFSHTCCIYITICT